MFILLFWSQKWYFLIGVPPPYGEGVHGPFRIHESTGAGCKG